MTELNDIITNYTLIEPVICMASGAIVGTVTRLFQNCVTHKDNKTKAHWLPGGSAVTGIVIASQFGGETYRYITDEVATVTGDYLGKLLIDRLTTHE